MCQPIPQTFQHLLGDDPQLGIRELTENEDVVQTVEKLRAKDLFEILHEILFLHSMAGLLPAVLSLGREANTGAGLGDALCAQVGGEDDDRVAKIHLAAMGVGQNAIFHDL